MRSYFIVIPHGHEYAFNHPKGHESKADGALRNELDLVVCEFGRNNGMISPDGEILHGDVYLVRLKDNEDDVMFYLRTGIKCYREYIPNPNSFGTWSENDTAKYSARAAELNGLPPVPDLDWDIDWNSGYAKYRGER